MSYARDKMSIFYKKTIVVTGGTGSFGKELVRHLLKNEQPETVWVYDVDKTEQFEFQHDYIQYWTITDTIINTF